MREIREVKKFGNSAHVVLAKELIGKKVAIITEEDALKMDQNVLEAMASAKAGDPAAKHLEEAVDQAFSDKHDTKKMTADEETAIIRENKEKPEAQEPHEFQAAEWTHKNGHPRCKICGCEEMIGGICPGLRIIQKASSKQPSFTKLADIIKEQAAKFLRTTGRQPTEKELMEIVFSLRNSFEEEIKRAVAVEFKRIYDQTMEGMERTLDMNFTFDQRDLNAIRLLLDQDVLTKSFRELSSDLAGKVKDVLLQAYNVPGGLSLDKIREGLKEATEMSDSRAELIARVETGAVSAAARRNSYLKADPDDLGLYKHIGPDDHRTTQASKEIKALTSEGVPWDDYVRIVSEVSAKHFPTWKVNPQAPVSHWQSRHTFVKIR